MKKLGRKKKHIIIYDKPINPNDFIINKEKDKANKINKDLDTFGLTYLIQSRMRKVIASY